jgi:hypothetical protein
MKWIKIECRMPSPDEWVLVFYPVQKDKHLRIQLVQGKFVPILKGCTHWAIVEEPEALEQPQRR